MADGNEKAAKYLFFDTESCSEAWRGGLCSFGYVLTDGEFNVLEKEDILINPKPKKFDNRVKRRVPLAYSESEFRAAPTFPQLYERIKGLVTENIVVGFSAVNDVMFLYGATKAYRLPPLNFEFYDAQIMFGVFKNENRLRSLKAAADEFGFEFRQHCSLDDAEATMAVVKGIAAAEKLDFEELARRYELRRGTVKNGLMLAPDTLRLTGEEMLPKNRRAVRNIFIRKHNSQIRSKVRVCFDERIEESDEFYAALAELNRRGWRYGTTGDCNMLVYCDTEGKNYRSVCGRADRGKIKLVSKEEFGELPSVSVDERKFLQDYLRRRKQREMDIRARK